MTQAFDNNNFDEENDDDVFDSNNPTEPGSTDGETNTKTKFVNFWKKVKNKTTETTSKTINYSKNRLSIEGQLKQARISLEKYIDPQIFNKKIKDTKIPKWVLKKAQGIVFLSIVKIGVLFGGTQGGTGIVMAKTKNGSWSGVSSIGIGGLSAGLLVGISKSDLIIPDKKSVEKFSGKGQFRIGGNVQLAAGPIGRDGSASVGVSNKGISVVFSYSHSVGLYGGIGLDGAIITVRPDCNETFYKQKVESEDILSGKIEMLPNNDYDMIVRLLNSYCINDNNNNNNNNDNDNDNSSDKSSKRLSIDDQQSDEGILDKNYTPPDL